MTLRVISWNLFHGRSQPATRRDLFGDFAAALASIEWDVCTLQEVPTWWPAELGRRLGASVRTTRTSLLRASLPQTQRRIHIADPERIGVRGAAVNTILVRSGAGEVLDHRSVRLRRCPQRRTMHAVELLRPGGERWWIANLHTTNKPESKAAIDSLLALHTVRAWADDSAPHAGVASLAVAAPPPILVTGDFNLHVPQGLVRLEGFDHLHGRHVDHFVARGLQLADGSAITKRLKLADGNAALSDHHLIGGTVR